MTNFTKGKWIEWTSSDDDGSFSHVGLVIASSKTDVTFESITDGVMVVEINDGEFRNVKARKEKSPRPPQSVRDMKVNRPAPASVQKALSAKMVQAVELVKANPGLARKDYIQLIVSSLAMSAGGASTYYNTARKHA